jgi:chromosome segregation ATPase
VKFKRTVSAVVLTLSVLCVTVTSAQQPREQGPPPASCPQAERENSAMRDRIASLERQVDATNEEAKTFYLRAQHLWEAYAGAIRLADHYRSELAYERARYTALENELKALRARRRR